MKYTPTHTLEIPKDASPHVLIKRELEHIYETVESEVCETIAPEFEHGNWPLREIYESFAYRRSSGLEREDTGITTEYGVCNAISEFNSHAMEILYSHSPIMTGVKLYAETRTSTQFRADFFFFIDIMMGDEVIARMPWMLHSDAVRKLYDILKTLPANKPVGLITY